jgi:phosphoribosyl-ATP pyrophosphohydrolase
MAKQTKKKSATAARGSKARKGHTKKPRSKATGFEIDFDLEAQLKARASTAYAPLPASLSIHANADVLNRLWTIIESRKDADPDVSHSARLLARGAPRVVQKLGEEAVECLIEVMVGNRAGTIAESADLLYHLLVAWVHMGIRPEEVWQELRNRESVSHLTEGPGDPIKRLLGALKVNTSKIP